MKRPFLYIFLAFASGILTGRIFAVHALLISIAIILISALIFIFRKKNPALISLLFAAVFIAGFAFYRGSSAFAPCHLSRIVKDAPRRVFMRGTVRTDPLWSNTGYGYRRTSFVFCADALQTDGAWRKTYGNAVVTVSAKKDISIETGDSMIVEGMLSEPVSARNPGVFNHSEYLRTKNIYAYLKARQGFYIKNLGRPNRIPSIDNVAAKLRKAIRRIIDRHFDAREGGFLKAVLIGERTGLERPLMDDFSKTGTMHILAISGLHVGMIAAMLIGIFSLLRVPARLRLAAASFCLVFYCIMTGSPPSIVRAVIMFVLFAAGRVIDRQSDTVNSLSIAAFIILFAEPRALFDIGFQLSFASVFSIAVLAPRIRNFFTSRFEGMDSPVAGIASFFAKTVSVSLAAWIGTAPLIAGYFNIVSLISVIANIVIVTMMGLCMFFAFVFLLSSLLGNHFAYIFSFPLSLIVDTLFSFNGFFSGLPLAYFHTAAAPRETTVLYYCFIGIMLLPERVAIFNLRFRRGMLMILILALLNLTLWSTAVGDAVRGDFLEITFLDVGQGDSAFMNFSDRFNILVDGGSGGMEEGSFDAGRRAVAPFLRNKGISRIDAVIVTHMHEDHFGGLIYIIENFDIGCVIEREGFVIPGNAVREYENALRRRGVRRVSVCETDVIDAFGIARFYVLNPPRGRQSNNVFLENDNSMVFKLLYKDFSALFCADITAPSMDALTGKYGAFLRSDIVKVPHHGGNPGGRDAAERFYSAASPYESVVSVGRFNRYNAPSPETLMIISESGSRIRQTKDEGAVSYLIRNDYRSYM